MSNRRRLRATDADLLTAYPDVSSLLTAALTYRCPDCDGETSPPVLAGGVGHVEVRHDDTCPLRGGRDETR